MSLRIRIFLALALSSALAYFGAPAGDEWVMVFNAWKAGVMVWVDAAIVMAAVTMLVLAKKREIMVICITLMHTFHGYLGLGMLSAEFAYLQLQLDIVIYVTAVLGLYFIVGGLTSDDDDPAQENANMINVGVISLGALLALVGFYNGMSVDELFAVLQRYQWMVAQGWSDTVKFIAVTSSMGILYGLLNTVRLAMEENVSVEWIDRNADRLMFVVFSLIMYYIVRGIVQNLYGYEPWEIPYTGLAPSLVLAGFILTALLNFILKISILRSIITKALLVDVDWVKPILGMKREDDKDENSSATV